MDLSGKPSKEDGWCDGKGGASGVDPRPCPFSRVIEVGCVFIWLFPESALKAGATSYFCWKLAAASSFKALILNQLKISHELRASSHLSQIAIKIFEQSRISDTISKKDGKKAIIPRFRLCAQQPILYTLAKPAIKIVYRHTHE